MPPRKGRKSTAPRRRASLSVATFGSEMSESTEMSELSESTETSESIVAVMEDLVLDPNTDPNTDDETDVLHPVPEDPEEPEHNSASDDESDGDSEYSEYSDDDEHPETKDPVIEAFDRSDDEDIDDCDEGDDGDDCNEGDDGNDGDDGDKEYLPDSEHANRGTRAMRAPRSRAHRFRPGTVALREIRYYQKTTHMLIPKGNFQRIVREVDRSVRHLSHQKPTRFTPSAMEALQVVAEDYLVRVFQRTQVVALHAGREQITMADLRDAASTLKN